MCFFCFFFGEELSAMYNSIIETGFFFSFDTVLLCSSCYPGSHCVEHTDFKPTEIQLPLPLSAGIKGVRHYAWPGFLLDF